MNLLDIPEAEFGPVPRFFIQEKDRDPASEKARVVRFRNALRMKLPAARVVAVPNAGKRGYAAQAQVKAEGLAKGFPDIICMYSGESVYFEFKGSRTMPTPEQTEWLNYLHDNGQACAVVRTAEGALGFLREQGWPV